MSSSLDVDLATTADGHSDRRGVAEERDAETGEGREEREEDSDHEQTDLSSILAYLIRSGQVRILTSDREDNSLSDDDDDFYRPTSSRVPAVDPKPDTTFIKQNDLYEEILLKSGRSSVFDKKHPTVPQMVYKRQTGMRKCTNFTSSQKRVIMSPFLPNFCNSVATNFRHKVFCGTYSKEGHIFLSASQDQNIRIYDTQNDRFNLKKTIRAKDVGWSVLDTAFSPDGNYMAYSSWSECIHLCNVHGDDDIHTALHLFPSDSSFCIFSLTFSSDNKEILGGANDGHLYVYDRDSNQRTLRIDAHDDDVNAVAFADETSQILFSGADDGLCKVWDRRTLKEGNPQPVGILAGHYDGVTYIDPKGDARYLLTNSKDQTMKLWDIRLFSTEEGVERTKKAVSKQRWDYRWQKVPKKMGLRPRLMGDTSVMTYRGHEVLHTLIRCHFSPEFTTGQRYVYTGCATGSCVIYDTLTGNIVRKLEGHRSCVRDVSWHPFENNIVTSSWDGSIRKWEYMDRFAMLEGSSSDSSEDESYEPPRQRRSLRRLAKKRQLSTSECGNSKKRPLFE